VRRGHEDLRGRVSGHYDDGTDLSGVADSGEATSVDRVVIGTSAET